MAGTGKKYKFHGAFKSKQKAVRRESARPGSWIERTTIRGRTRYLVVTKK